jgi:hypothetical protein
MAETQDPIVQVVAKWHLHMRGQLEGGLDTLLADDCVFLSPIVFTPQVGKEITKLYLTAASKTFPGDGSTEQDGEKPSSGGSFHYVKEILSGHHAMLEFETKVDGKYVNGIDLISCNDDGQISEFKVMIRPLQAVNLIHEQMKKMLERLG